MNTRILIQYLYLTNSLYNKHSLMGTLGVPDSVYARFNILSYTYHPAPCYLNSNKVFLFLSDQYCNPERGFKPGSSSDCLLQFYTCSKPLGHHGVFFWKLNTCLFSDGSLGVEGWSKYRLSVDGWTRRGQLAAQCRQQLLLLRRWCPNRVAGLLPL